MNAILKRGETAADGLPDGDPGDEVNSYLASAGDVPDGVTDPSGRCTIRAD